MKGQPVKSTKDHDKFLNFYFEEFIEFLKRSNFDFLFDKHQDLQSIFKDRRLLEQLIDYKSGHWEFDEVEVLTTLVFVWNNNNPDINPDLRSELMDILLNLYNIGNYDLMLAKLSSMKKENRASFKKIIQPVVENWQQVDRYNVFSMLELLNNVDIDEAQQIVKEANPYDIKEQYSENGRAYLSRIQNHLGVKLHDRKQYREAIAYYEKAATLEPKNALYLRNKAIAYDWLEEFEKAAKAYQLAAEYETVTEQKAKDYNYAGVQLHKQENYREAIPLYEKAIALEPRHPLYLRNKANAHNWLEEYEEAIAAYKAAIQHESEQNAAAKAKDYNYIGVQFHKQKKYRDAIPYYEKAIALEPGNVLFLRNKANAYNWLEEYEEAIAAYKAVIQHESDQNTAEKAKDYNYIGVQFNKQKKYREAIPYYEKAIELAPQNPQYLRNKAIAYDWLREAKDASEAYQLAAQYETNPVQKAKDLNYAGVQFHDLQQYKKAIECYEKAIALEPENALFLRNKANAFNRLGRYEEAVAAYLVAAQHETDAAEQAKDYNATGLIYSNQYKDEEALQYYQKALEKDPGVQVYAANIAYSFRYLNKLEEAAQYYKKAIQLDANIHQNYYDYGNVLLKMNKQCEAKAQFKKALELKPGDNNYKSAFEKIEC